MVGFVDVENRTVRMESIGFAVLLVFARIQVRLPDKNFSIAGSRAIYSPWAKCGIAPYSLVVAVEYRPV